jgi:hypothetical protein
MKDTTDTLALLSSEVDTLVALLTELRKLKSQRSSVLQRMGTTLDSARFEIKETDQTPDMDLMRKFSALEELISIKCGVQFPCLRNTRKRAVPPYQIPVQIVFSQETNPSLNPS